MAILDGNLNDKAFWQSLCPDLTITDSPMDRIDKIVELSDAEANRCSSRLTEEGYYIAEQVLDSESINLIADSIRLLTKKGYPAPFIFMYDEPWQVFYRLSKVYRDILGEDYQIRIGGIWAWNLDGNDHGFDPHRDSNTNESIKTGKPSNLTIWVPVTDADADNGCMYVLPLNLDPNYPNNLDRMQMSNPKHIRALPAPAGSAIAWIQNIIHWGSQSSAWAKAPRLSIAASFSSLETGPGNNSYATDDISSPTLPLKPMTQIPLQKRLQIIASAIWYYGNRVFTLYPEISEQLFSFSREFVVAETRNEIDSRYDELMLLSKQHRAQHFYQRQQFSAALPLLEESCASKPNDINLRLALGMTLSRLGRNEDALAQLNHAKQLDPGNAALQQAINSLPQIN